MGALLTTTRVQRVSSQLVGWIGLLLVQPAMAQSAIVNGGFDDTTGAPWVFVDPTATGTLNYLNQDAAISGGDDSSGNESFVYIEQSFATATAGSQAVTFDWSYSSFDIPGFDGAMWDLLDSGTGLSVIAGPLVLAYESGAAGAVNTLFSGSGTYTLRLGTWSLDSGYGPGTTTFDNVFVPSGVVPFRRGDVNLDGSIDIGDAIALLTNLFVPGTTPLGCLDSGDLNDDGTINIGDPISLLTHLFSAISPPLPPPAGVCGDDPTADTLQCAGFGVCP
ncbi:MAG: hypothetical protein ACKVX7_19400 [Planctomycetota bacterium]